MSEHHIVGNHRDSPWELPPLTVYDDEPKADPARKLAPDPKGRVVLRPAYEVVAERRETSWLLYKILEARVLAVIAGARGTFKSFIGLDWLMRVALTGRTVVLLSGEGAGLDRRIDAWMKTHAPDTDLAGLSVLVLEHPLNLSIAADMIALTEAFTALPTKPVAVLVDTFSKFSAGIDENDNSQVALYLTGLSEAIREAFGCTVLLVAHSGHGDAARPRGASSLMANPDAEYIVRRATPADMTVTVTRERFKDGAALSPLAYEARVVDLGRCDAYGEPVTSLALLTTDAPATKAKVMGKNQEKAIVALKEWVRVNPDAVHITSIDTKAIFKNQGIGDKRRGEVLAALVNIRVLSPSIGGYTIDRAML